MAWIEVLALVYAMVYVLPLHRSARIRILITGRVLLFRSVTDCILMLRVFAIYDRKRKVAIA